MRSSSRLVPACCPGLYCLLWLGLPTGLTCPLISAIRGRLWATCQSSQQRVTAELGKKAKSQVFFPPQEPADPQQVLELLGKRLLKPVTLLAFMLAELVTAAGHSASSVNGEFPNCCFRLNALCSQLGDVEIWMFTNLMTRLISNDTMSPRNRDKKPECQKWRSFFNGHSKHAKTNLPSSNLLQVTSVVSVSCLVLLRLNQLLGFTKLVFFFFFAHLKYFQPSRDHTGSLCCISLSGMQSCHPFIEFCHCWHTVKWMRRKSDRVCNLTWNVRCTVKDIFTKNVTSLVI